MTQQKKFLWATDIHLCYYNRLEFVRTINRHNPSGVFLTGDISHLGFSLYGDMEYIGRETHCPIYFILGNHSIWFSSFAERYKQVRELCSKYPNLIWMNNVDVIPLSNEVALIGNENWYDGTTETTTKKIKFSKAYIDWLLIKDFRELKNMDERVLKFREIAGKSAEEIGRKLSLALEQDYKRIFILSHMPFWDEATRDVGTLFDWFWLPYNVNVKTGKVIKEIMKERKKRNVVCLFGHTHSPHWGMLSRNIEYFVGRPSGYFKSEPQIMYI